MKALLVTLIMACGITSAKSQSVGPIAGKTYTLTYSPALSGILQDAKQIWIVYVFDYWGTKAHQVQKGESGDSDLLDNVLDPDSGRATKVLMTKDGGSWQVNIAVPSDAALLSYYFTDGIQYDFNDKKTYVSYVFNENGRPVRNARFRNVDFLIMAGENHQAVIDELEKEITDYPDNYLAHVVCWRFKIFDTVSPDTLKMLESDVVPYYSGLRKVYGDTVLSYEVTSLYDFDRVIQLSLRDSVMEPTVAALTKSVNSDILATVSEIREKSRSARIEQIESYAEFMLLPPEKRQRLQEENEKKLKEMVAEFVGQPAPDFSFETVTGEKHRLSDFRGKYVLLDFWGSWCGPCVGELPNLVKAYARYGHKDLVMISVSSDAFASGWSAEKLAGYADSKGMKWMQVLDDKAKTIDELYKVQFWPNPFLVGPDGKVLQRDGLRGDQLDKTLSGLFGK